MKRSLAGPALSLIAAALLGSPAQAAAEPSTIDLLEQEKAAYNVYKAYFPSLEIARKAAITFHGQLLESDYAGGFLVLQLEADEMARLRDFGFRFERATEFIQRRNRALTQFQMAASQRAAGVPGPQSIPGYACYETVEETFAAADSLIAAQPTLASWANAGSSWLKTQNTGGYDIKVLKLTHSATPGVGGEAKPKLFINSAIHAREYTTAPLVLEFARWLVNGWGTNADATWILKHHEVHLMLHTNPDGRKKAETGLSWRKNVNNNFCANTNTRGIDLNRNFGFTWNSTAGQGSSGSACSLTYRGPTAASEPETQAIEGYIRSLWPDRRGPGLTDAAPSDTSGVHLDIHSYSQLVLWPWGETAAQAPNGLAMQTMGRRLAWFNGYTPQQSIGLYPTDGTSDSPSYGELGVASFTIELGSAFFESCAAYTSTTKPNNLPALVYAAKVARTPYITPAGPDVTVLTLAGDASSAAGVPAGTVVALTASATDTRFNNSNGTEATQAIAAAEYSIDLAPWQPGVVALPLAAADGSFDASTEGLTGNIATAGLLPGQHTVYTRARDAAGVWGPVTAVFLSINTAAPLPVVLVEVEPNGTPETALLVPTLPALINGSVQGSRGVEERDLDYHRVTVGAGLSLTATLTPSPGSNPNLEVLDASGVRLARSSQGAGLVDSVTVTNPAATPVTLFVRVSYAGGGYGVVNGRYTLALSQSQSQSQPR